MATPRGFAITCLVLLAATGLLFLWPEIARRNPREARAKSPSEPTRTEKLVYYVTETVEVRLAPSSKGRLTSTLDRPTRVEVQEIKDGWARISGYYNGSLEGVPDWVARWIPAKSLAKERPLDEPPRTSGDSRISGIPKVGDGGLSARDVNILYAAAVYFLETGKTRRIEYGDKSVSRPGAYYLNFGGSKNHFFRPKDIPDLDRRIEMLDPD